MGVLCRRHRRQNSIMSLYTDTGWTCPCATHECGAPHWKPQLLILMSSVRPNQIITSSSTCEAKTQPQCHLVAQSEKPYEFTPWHVNTLRHCSVTEASMVGCVLCPTDSEVI